MMINLRSIVSVVILLSFAQGALVHAQGGRARGRADLVLNERLQARWSADGNRFWYRQELADGKSQFILVDAVSGSRLPAFDHSAVARELGADPERLPLEELQFTKDQEVLLLIGREARWSLNLKDGTLGDANKYEGEPAEEDTSAGPPSRTGADTEISFENRMSKSVEIFWVSDDGRRSYGKIAPGGKHRQHTFGGHRWAVVVEDGEELGVIAANDAPTTIVLDGRKLRDGGVRRRRERLRTGGSSTGLSPDGKWRASIEEHNVVIRANDGDAKVISSSDGTEQLAYGQLAWSPDSKTLIAFRTEAGERLEVHLVRSSPPEGGRANLESRPYALPGDKFARHELNVFSISEQRQIKPDLDRFEHEWETPRLRWSSDAQHVMYEQVDRGHQRLRIVDVEVVTGNVRYLVDERSETFIWTTHNESGVPTLSWLDKTPELIYASEMDGWRHLYLIDTESGVEKNAITSGHWIVRGIDLIDEDKRQLWFRASGCYADQDPYLVHYGRVNFDGTGLTWLTAGNGNHTLSYSPDRRFLIDSYSRVDLSPVHELRKVDDGSLVCQLEKSDVSALKADGWSPPEVFSAKGRDGKTDIWGIICRPRDFDPNKKYPVIEDIYAGPQGAFVPKSFSPTLRYEALTSLGFIVVKIDGMGTALRSKAFHDVCWHNLKDGGFEDRIAWMKAAAATRPEMDLARVGIYGTSAGGQNAAAAVLFHPEFYKAAVASCGCHDNRMDKASWNEQWMGYPVGPHYGACSNIDNAHLLGGKLLLIVGEMDTNVPPESTMRLVDALIRADKDFDLLVVPNAGHGNGGPYGVRRMHKFFEEHLVSPFAPQLSPFAPRK